MLELNVRWTRLLEVINGLCKTASGSGASALLDCALRGVVVGASEDLLGLLSDVVPLAVCQAVPWPCVLLGPLYFATGSCTSCHRACFSRLFRARALNQHIASPPLNIGRLGTKRERRTRETQG